VARSSAEDVPSPDPVVKPPPQADWSEPTDLVVPFPAIPSSMLRDLESMCPGATRLLLDNYVAEAENRRAMDRQRHETRATIARESHWQAVGLSVAFLVVVVILAWIGQPWVAGVLGSLDLVAIIALLIGAPTKPR
jgi:hypothetical protein